MPKFEWENEPEVLSAKKTIEDNDRVIAEIDKESVRIAEELAELERQQRELEKKMSALRQERIIERRTRSAAERDRASATALIEDAKKAYETRIAVEAEKKRLSETLDNFAWYTGVVSGSGKTLKAKQHQVDGAMFLATNKRVILGDSMGVGKSLTTLAALDIAGIKEAIYVAPSDVTGNLANEAARWAPHRIVLNIAGKTKIERNAMIAALEPLKTFGASSMIIVNYEAWRRDKALIRGLLSYRPGAVLMDEAHGIKDITSAAYEGCRRLCHEHNACAICGAAMDPASWGVRCDCGSVDSVSTVQMIVPMTGTPILNRPHDMFALLSIIDPDTYNSLHRFLVNYAEQEYDGKWLFAPGGYERLAKRLEGRVLRRTLKDVGIFLDEPITTIHEVEVTKENYPQQRRVMDELSQHASITLSRTDEYGNPLAINTMAQIALITRLRQAATYPAGIEIKDEFGQVVMSVSEDVQESAKIDKAIQVVLEAVEDGRRVAVFSQFKGALISLDDQLALMGVRTVRLDGDTDKETRAAIKTNFDKSQGEESKWDVVLANYKTGGVGLNFTACTVLVTLDEEWNAGKKDQALARVQRIGQDEQVFIHEIMVKGSIDQWMRSLVEAKREMADGLHDAISLTDGLKDYLESL